MTPSYEPYTPETVRELLDFLGYINISAPAFGAMELIILSDDDEHAQAHDINTIFNTLKNSVLGLRATLGGELCEKLLTMSREMYAKFLADPLDTTGETLAGREIIYDMQALLEALGVD